MQYNQLTNSHQSEPVAHKASLWHTAWLKGTASQRLTNSHQSEPVAHKASLWHTAWLKGTASQRLTNSHQSEPRAHKASLWLTTWLNDWTIHCLCLAIAIQNLCFTRFCIILYQKSYWTRLFYQAFQVFNRKTKEQLGNYQVFRVFQGFQSLGGQLELWGAKLTSKTFNCYSKLVFYQVLHYFVSKIMLNTCVLPGFPGF